LLVFGCQELGTVNEDRDHISLDLEKDLESIEYSWIVIYYSDLKRAARHGVQR
jgi:hypothetical protein